jgi:hypothetical protein
MTSRIDGAPEVVEEPPPARYESAPDGVVKEIGLTCLRLRDLLQFLPPHRKDP